MPNAIKANPKQLKLFGRDQKQEKPFGGSLLKNSHAKVKRPFAPRATMHVTLKTNGYGRLLSWGRRKRVDAIVHAIAKTNRTQVIKFANVGNHLHLLLSCREKERLTGFLRGISGAVARLVLVDEMKRSSVASPAQGTRAANDLQSHTSASSGRFWLQRPWSRIVKATGHAFNVAARYVDLNSIESWGLKRHQAIVYWDKTHLRARRSGSG